MEKVVVTGLGAVCSIGNNVDEYWHSLINSASGISKIQGISTDEHDTKIGAEVDDSFEEIVKKQWKKRQLNATTKSARMGLCASVEAVENSGINFDECDRTRVAVIYGVSESGMRGKELDDRKNFILKDMLSTVPAMISMRYNIHGASFSIATACATSANAIVIAKQMIESGVYDVVIAGGMAGKISHDILGGFNQLLALSVNPDPETACRPFTKGRDGFIMGEGAGTLVLESETFAKKRNARIYCQVAGGAMYSEAFNMTAPETNGTGMAECMRMALENAGISPEKVDYINAHGTSTGLNDKYETMAIKEIFGENAKNIPISSTKSAIGHTLGACGALEAVVCVKALENGIIPPTLHYDEPDPELDLDYVPNKAREKELNVVVSNSFAFGGRNATLIFNKYNG
ncbi:MAG: beta-ketoacyl-[acyl-carrier-protein] synthase family protein [Ruminococcus sp.]|nr:beta-ketoacyl-[acyl-carrier-protein] synthase family protein [Ruminococcus sp.]